MTENLKSQTQFRVVVGKEASDSLDEAVSFVNDGFAAGSVSRTDLASYLFRNAKKYIGKGELERIRNEFFDERLALEKLVRGQEAGGKFPKNSESFSKTNSE